MMAPTIANLLVISLTAFQGLIYHIDAKQQHLCADKSGIFLGLAIDENSYESIIGSELVEDTSEHGHNHTWGTRNHTHTWDNRTHNDHGDHPHFARSGPPQQWVLTDKGSTGPKNSYGGQYLQVLPDIGRTYPSGHGKHLKSVKDLEGESPYLSFKLRVEKGGEGWHTLFARWTGGDDYGGGDSFYVVMKQKGTIIPGQRTVKPSVVPIDSAIITYAGCCYNEVTHACPCHHYQPDEATCPARDFLPVERALHFEKQCVVGEGMMDIVKDPQWYLFSGQEDATAMDFEEEPWDTTCEANGSNTADSGHDFPSWNLKKAGDYELRVYAREDGTAFDGIYIAGPDGVAPGITHTYNTGDSTLCPRSSMGVLKTIGIFVGVGVGLAGLVAFLTITDQGQEVAHKGRLVINRVLHTNSAQDSIREYEQMEQLDMGYHPQS